MSAARRVLVTGASQGLGLAIARAFVAAGCDVAICARDASALERAAGSLRNDFPEARLHARVADVASEASVDALFADVETSLGGLDVLVANAGVYGPKGAIEDVDWSTWVDAIRINLIGTVYCARRALPLLRRSERGKIVILSGGGATKPLPYVSAYAASKAGVVRFGETLAEELRDVRNRRQHGRSRRAEHAPARRGARCGRRRRRRGIPRGCRSSRVNPAVRRSRSAPNCACFSVRVRRTASPAS